MFSLKFLEFKSCFQLLLKLLLYVACVLFVCEVLIYYVVLLGCTWPLLDKANEDPSIQVDKANENPLKVMMVADTHLLGPIRGHWFDKLRREWQMSRTFSTAMTLHQPEVVVFLGDVFDEGQWMDSLEFGRDVERFHKIFPRSGKTKFIVAVGNHDVGFHYKMNKRLIMRFQRIFSQSMSGVDAFNIRGNYFVSLNSMAFEGDNCVMCQDAERDMRKIEMVLNCSRRVHERQPVSDDCVNLLSILPHYSRPIVLQHFPLFRMDDAKCQDRDVASSELEKFRPKWEVISEEMTSRILGMRPRAVFDGHIHHSCKYEHHSNGTAVPEWTLPSFNWRNKNNPSFVLAAFTPNNFAVSRCSIPKESSVILLYISSLLLLLWLLVRRCQNNSRYQGFSRVPSQK